MVSYNIQPNGGAVGGELPANYITISGGDPSLTLLEAVGWDTGDEQALLPYTGDDTYIFNFLGGDTEWNGWLNLTSKSTVTEIAMPDMTAWVGGSEAVSLWCVNATGLELISFPNATIGAVYLNNTAPASSTLRVAAGTIASASGSVAGQSIVFFANKTTNAEELILDAQVCEGSVSVRNSSNLLRISGSVERISNTVLRESNISSNVNLESINWTNLQSVAAQNSGDYLSIRLEGCADLTTVNLGSAVLDGGMFIRDSGRGTLTITAGEIGPAGGPSIPGQSISNFGKNNAALSELVVNCPILLGSITLTNNANLSDVTLNATQIENGISFNNCNLSRASVDHILEQCATGNAGGIVVNTGTKTIDLRNRNASPTGGASNTHKLALEADGWTVLTS